MNVFDYASNNITTYLSANMTKEDALIVDNQEQVRRSNLIICR